MDYIDYGRWLLLEKTKDGIAWIKQKLTADEFRMKRDRWLEFAFAFQMQLVVGISIFFRQEAAHGIRTIFAVHCDSLNPFIAASVSAMAACGIFCVSTATVPQYTSHIAYTVSWATPLLVGVTLASFQSEKRSWVSQYPLFVIAGAVYVFLSAAFACVRNQLRFPTTILKSALKSLSFHPRLFRQTIMLTFLLNLWTIAWCVAVVGVYDWTKQQRNLVARTVVYSEDAYSTHLSSLWGLTNDTKQQTLLLEQNMKISRAMIGFFLLSLYWTQQACRNLIQVATASAVGLWWRTGRPQTDASFLSVLPLSIGKFLLKSLQVHRTRTICRVTNLAQSIVRWRDASPRMAKGTIGNIKYLTQNSSRLSLLYLGFYGTERKPSNSSDWDEKVRRRALEAIWKDRRLDYFLSLCIFAIAMISGCLTWLLDSTNAMESFFLGFLCGWISGGSLLAIVKAAADSNFLGVAEFQPDGNLLRTDMCFALKKELI